MKKALQISIAQTLFTIEEDAYTVLDHYLASIRAHFQETTGNEDIISDIESRIAEQFHEMGARIITLREVESVIRTMGKVEDFGTESVTGKTSSAKGSENKKLYRDPDNKIIFGVCSGISAYTGIDALWIRIAFILLTVFMQGLGLILYIIMIIAVPSAKTPSQKLEMKGSPVTLDTISKNVKEKAEEIRTKHGSKITHALSLPFVALKNIVDFIVVRLGPSLRIILGICIAAIAVVGMIAISFLAPATLINGSSYIGFQITDAIAPALFYFTIAAAYISLFIPLAFLFILGTFILRKKSFITGGVSFALLCIWCVAVASTGVASTSVAQKLHNDPTFRLMYEGDMVESELIYTK
jgi:phage shock protein PspC (stress-responsive transcriptional regulator)